MKILVIGSAEQQTQDMNAQLTQLSIPYSVLHTDSYDIQKIKFALAADTYSALMCCVSLSAEDYPVLAQLCEERNLQLYFSDHAYRGLQKQYLDSQKAVRRAEEKAARQEEHLRFVEANYALVVNSKGHQLLTKYYALREKLRPGNLIHSLLAPFQKFAAAWKKKHNPGMSRQACIDSIRTCRRIDIMAVPHTAYVAQLLQSILLQAGLESHIHFEQPEQYDEIPYIIICPQNFSKFPPVYMAYQMEQTVSSRWLTDDYFTILRNAFAVFDYSLVNIDYFRQYPDIACKLFYVPIDLCNEMAHAHTSDTEKEYDVLFYGAMNERRRAYLDRIAQSHKIKIITEQFGDALYAEMKKAKLVVNIHFYENALLETTRLYETLSVCDSLVLSERSCDCVEDARLDGLVEFVDVGDIDGMCERISYWLRDDKQRTDQAAHSRKILSERSNSTVFYLNRFLLANDRIDFDTFYNRCGNYVQLGSDRICLSLPETTDRRAAFDADNRYGFEVFPGLKHHIGWIGCGMSYKFIFRKAIEQKLGKLIVCEDDVYFPADFEERFRQILNYTSTHDDWKIFSGIMGDMGDVTVLDYVREQEEDFVYLDKMMSMVFNMYDPSIFETISQWDHTALDKATNTIDRYLEDKCHRVLTTCPFLVGHKEDLDSTIWNHKNDLYNPGIENSSKKLHLLVDSYLYRQRETQQ